MSCPFRRAASQHQFANGGTSGKKEFRSRQSSVHLPGPEEEDGDTLTLKHLSEALKLLTAPSVSCFIRLRKKLFVQFSRRGTFLDGTQRRALIYYKSKELKIIQFPDWKLNLQPLRSQLVAVPQSSL